MYFKVEIDDANKAMEILRENGIELVIYADPYMAVCHEEIEQTAYAVSKDGKSFDEICGDKAYDVISACTRELFESREAEQAFQTIAETSELIIGRANNC